MDTTSSALAQLLHLLAQRPDVQEKLRLELDAAYENGELAHGEVVGLPYLDANLQSDVCVRRYPPVPFVGRMSEAPNNLLRGPARTQEDPMLPLSTPIVGRDGTKIRKVFGLQGTRFFVRIMVTNRGRTSGATIRRIRSLNGGCRPGQIMSGKHTILESMRACEWPYRILLKGWP